MAAFFLLEVVTMTEIDFYKTDDSQNTINKTLTKTGTKNINLLFSYDFIEFKAYLKGDPVLLGSNYAIIDNKHYFLNLENIGGTIYLVSFTLDLLETYKDVILASDFDIIEKSRFGTSSDIPTSSEIEQKIYKSDKELEFTNTIILTSTGEELQ